MADGGGFLFPYDIAEYWRAIQAAPNGSLIGMGDVQPEPWAECTECGAQMDWVLTQYHVHGGEI